ncbi:MAG: prephenate dehydrogenase/arogenate dehydrogenase family protein [bacterium]|nr:prephenate dehydrogenase/arogenate dehydrogenase family protein [bacterium]
MKNNKKIGIIGLGLIGGSILKELSNDFEVFGVSKSEATIEKAKKYSNNASTDLNILKDCEIIFVCTPMNKTLEILNKLDTIISKDAIVTDCCSLKEFVTQKDYNYNFIPSHPMAGTENNGFDASFVGLFKDAKWVLTPYKNTSNTQIKKLTEIIELLGATPIQTTPKEHDIAVALISHMPMLVSQGIFKASSDNSLALKLASSGFRDTTRLSMTNIEMAEDMINMNSKNIETALLMLYKSIGELLKENYKEQISEIKDKRKNMYDKEGKNIL